MTGCASRRAILKQVIRLRQTLTPQTLPDAQSFNVVADLKGSEHPEQIVIVSGRELAENAAAMAVLAYAIANQPEPLPR